MRATLRIAFVLAIAALGACDSPTGDDSPRELTGGAPLDGQVTPGGRPQEFVLPQQGRIILRLQARSGSAKDTLIAELVDGAGNQRGQLRSIGTAAEPAVSGWLAAGEERRIRVRGLSTNDGGPFTISIFVEDLRPETASATLTDGVTVEGEAIDEIGDVDEYWLVGTEGETWIFFVQTFGGPVRLEVFGGVYATAEAGGATGELTERSTGRVTLSSTGTKLVRVSGGRADAHGPYRIRANRVNPAPEASAPALRVGEPVEEEIGAVGDVDEFTFRQEEAGDLRLGAQSLSGLAGGLTMVLGVSGSQHYHELTLTPGAEKMTGDLWIDQGVTYTLRVQGLPVGTAAAGTGRYRVGLYPPNPSNEGAAPLRIDGPPVEAALDPAGDADRFTLYGAEGQRVVMRLSAPSSTGTVQASLTDPWDRTVAVLRTSGGDQLSEPQVLELTGRYIVNVEAATHGLARGPYTLEISTVSATP
jgi:hypothetical protein